MNNACNLRAYDGVESTQLNLSDEEFSAYVQDKLESAKSDFEFIKQNFINERCTCLDVCEIGSGNSKLLYLLAQEGLLKNNAVGYEISKSRFNIAEKIKHLLNVRNVENRNMNFLDDSSEKCYDLILLVDIVFQMISPLTDTAEKEALNWIYKHLCVGGGVLFEIEDYTDAFKDGTEEYRRWEEFSEADPFRYGLYSMKKDADGNIVDEKIFLKRGTFEQSRTHSVWKSYTKERIVSLLEQYGFTAEIRSIYNSDEEKQRDIEKGIYREGLFRVLARKL